MKVLLVATNRMTTPFPVYPIGLDYVATALRGRHAVRTLDLACDEPAATLAEVCRAFAPDVVGLSIRNVDRAEAATPEGFIPDIERFVACIRSCCEARIVLGGPGFSIFPEALMVRLAADFGIVGEGEVLLGLLDALEHGAVPSRFPGLMVGRRCVGHPRPFTGPCRRRLTSMETVTRYLRWGGMLNIQTKRGCPFRCTYCTYPAIEGRALRLFHPESVAEEWRSLVEAGARFVFVTDAVFNSSIRHNLAIADALARQRLDVPWGAFFAPTRPRPGYFQRLRGAGLSHVEFGTESLSPAMLRSFRKPFTVEHALEAHRSARSADLHVAHYILLGGPGETEDTVQETLLGCEALDGAALFFFCGVRIYPSTALHEAAVREGQVDPQDDLLEPRFYAPAGMSVGAISARVTDSARGRPNWVLGSGNDAMAKSIQRMYQRGHVGPLWDRLVR